MPRGKLTFLLSAISMVWLTAGPVPSAAGTPCLEAVFFDLGNTLVENRGDGIFVLRPGTAETIDDLQAIGVRLGIITNVPMGWDINDLRAILEEPEFLDEFEVVTLSSEAPAPKPDPAIYIYAHESLAEPRPLITSTAFVGETLSEIADREIDPTRGARSVGMIGIHLSDLPPSPLADYTIPTDGLHEVVTIVNDSCDPAGAGDPPTESNSTLLFPPSPNPSNGSTRIGFSISTQEHVQIGIFDAQGRCLTWLVDNVVSPGTHELLWDGTDEHGVSVGNGVYFSRMLAGGELRRTSVVRLE